MTQRPSSRWAGRDGPTDGLSRRELLRGGAVGALGLWLPFRLQSRSAAWHARAAKAHVGPRALEELRRKLHGALLLPGDRGYVQCQRARNGRFADIRPLAVARSRRERRRHLRQLVRRVPSTASGPSRGPQLCRVLHHARAADRHRASSTKSSSTRPRGSRRSGALR